MIKFDKIKLLSKAGYISNIDCEKFVRCCKGDIQGEILNEKYQQKLPFYLLIMVDYQHDELVLEFTGKILLDKYTDLINRDTAKDCLEKINGLKICRLDVDSIMTDSEVSKCDVTKDIECNRMQDIITNVRQNLSNYKRWVTKPYGKKALRLKMWQKPQEIRNALSFMTRPRKCDWQTTETSLMPHQIKMRCFRISTIRYDSS